MAIDHARTAARRTVDLDAGCTQPASSPSCRRRCHAAPLIRAPGEFHHGLSPASVSALEAASATTGPDTSSPLA